ncbi:MAG: hypothetical protein M3R52_04625, partial [Acidobacteriota bacterium]|nr:hypothetical protein [Acidobacteriota bacterium]
PVLVEFAGSNSNCFAVLCGCFALSAVKQTAEPERPQSKRKDSQGQTDSSTNTPASLDPLCAALYSDEFIY